jgi:hypothetical protein
MLSQYETLKAGPMYSKVAACAGAGQMSASNTVTKTSAGKNQ